MFFCKKGTKVKRSKVKKSSDASKAKVALIIGHNVSSKGAVNYLGESEYDFNLRIAKKIQANTNINSIDVPIILRPTGSYSSQCKSVAKRCEALGVEFAIELHFNSSEVNAKGMEILTVNDSDYQLYAAKLLSSRLKLDVRHDDGILRISKGHNGYGMLKALNDNDIDAMIIEPCFAHYRHKDSIAIFENEDAYMKALLDIVLAVSSGQASK